MSNHALAPFVAAQLAHPTRIVPPELVGLATAYDGLTDAAYPGPERWMRKDELFRQMRSHLLVVGVGLDALESFGTTGLQVVAIAAMAADPLDEHLPRLEVMARHRPPINVAYKIADFARASAERKTSVGTDRVDALTKTLKLLEDRNAQDEGFNACARETRTILKAADSNGIMSKSRYQFAVPSRSTLARHAR